MHGEAVEKSKAILRKKSQRNKSIEIDVAGIEERGEGEEDERMGGSP